MEKKIIEIDNINQKQCTKIDYGKISRLLTASLDAFSEVEQNRGTYSKDEIELIKTTFSPESVRERMEQSCSFLCYINNELIGFVTVGNYGNGWEPKNLYVREEFHKTGIGSELVGRMENFVRGMGGKNFMPQLLNSQKLWSSTKNTDGKH